jgi:RNA polymerase sigma-70 factor (ECF subfamily)
MYWFRTHWQLKVVEHFVQKPPKESVALKNAAAIKSEAALIGLARSGNAEAFSELSTRHNMQVYRVSLKMLKNREDAEDNLQNTMFKAFRRIKQFNRESQFSTWLVRIAINEALMFLRSKRNRRIQDTTLITEDGEVLRLDVADPSTNPEREYMNKELASKVLKELSPPLKAIFLLHKIEGWTNNEMAEKFGLPSQRVKHRVFRARTILRKKLVSLSATSEPAMTYINTAA